MILAYELRGGYAPIKDRDTDAGWDLCSCEHRVMMPGEIHTFDLQIGLQWQLESDVNAMADPRRDRLGPDNSIIYGRLAPRSKLSRDYGVMVLGGVVDAEYTGNVKVTLARVDLIRNGMPNMEKWKVEPGMAIVQFIPEMIHLVKRASPVTELIPTDRGDKGFGSSGR